MREMTPGSFDPREVLQAIDDGALASGGGLNHLETVRLLAIACRRLADAGKLAEARVNPPTPAAP
jgi:hypothetical protein